jgi:hypothetical protein
MCDEELIASDICPVCRAPRRAKVNPRRALQEHMRASLDPAHVMWRDEHYAAHFKRGGDRTSRLADASVIKEAVARCFGEQWAAKIDIRP